MLYSIYLLAVYPAYLATIYATLRVIFKHERKNRIRYIIVVGISIAVAWSVAALLKELIAHPRPDLMYALFVPGDKYSFPSGHATYMFTLAFSMYSFDKKAFQVLFVLAVLTGIARVLSGVHYWYDILAGVLVAWVVVRGVIFTVWIISKQLYRELFYKHSSSQSLRSD